MMKSRPYWPGAAFARGGNPDSEAGPGTPCRGCGVGGQGGRTYGAHTQVPPTPAPCWGFRGPLRCTWACLAVYVLGAGLLGDPYYPPGIPTRYAPTWYTRPRACQG